MISQPKIDLVVLYKLHQHAEGGGEPLPPVDIQGLFEIAVPLRRVELALEELERRGEVERRYVRLHLDEGAWAISREGLARVDRALRVPSSFLARLHEAGDVWLESEEAESAILKKLSAPVAAHGQGTVNIIQNASLRVLIALVLEFHRSSHSYPKLNDINERYGLKLSDTLLEASISPWAERGWLKIYRTYSDGTNVGIDRDKFGVVYSHLLDAIKATIFEVDWKKEEILTDASAEIDLPAPRGWKVLFAEPINKVPPHAPPPVGSPIHITNTFAPVNNAQSPSQAPNPFAQSSAKAGWTNVWIGIVSALIALTGIAVTFWLNR